MNIPSMKTDRWREREEKNVYIYTHIYTIGP